MYLPQVPISFSSYMAEPHFFPRSLHLKAFLGQGTDTKRVIDTKVLTELIKNADVTCSDMSRDPDGETACDTLKVANYLNHFAYLTKEWEIYLERSPKEYLEDPRFEIFCFFFSLKTHFTKYPKE